MNRISTMGKVCVILLSLMALIVSSCAHTFDPAAVKAELDAALQKSVTTENGEINRNALLYINAPQDNFVYAGAAGLGRADTGEPMSIEHQYILASVGKTMTAVVILQLMEEGLLGPNGLDATLAELEIFPEEVIEQLHVMDGVSYGHEITIRHLLNHTSGIKDIQHDDENGIASDYSTGGWGAPNSVNGIKTHDEQKGTYAFIDCFQGAIPAGMQITEYIIKDGIPEACNPDDYYLFYQWPHWDYAAWKEDSSNKQAGLLNFYLSAMNQTPLFKPGTQYRYSDTNYIILALVIEALTGNSYHHELRTRIFDPLEMNDTYLRFSSDPAYQQWEYKLSEMWAMSYPSVTLGVNISQDWGGGGHVSTVHDQDVFIRALANGELFENQETLDEMLKYPITLGEVGGLFGKRPFGYACGLVVISREDGKPDIGHLGSSGAWLMYSMQSELSFIGTINEEADEGFERRLQFFKDIREPLKDIVPFINMTVEMMENPGL
jgi:CubicO group peptidase (beta-lactamase class C family)